MRASAATASARRHNSGSGAAIIPARSTPSMVRMFSTMLGNWMPTMASVGRPMRRSRAGNRRDHAVGLGIGQATRRAVGEALAVRRVGERQRVGPPLRDAAEQLVDGDAAAGLRAAASRAMRDRRGSLQRPLAGWRHQVSGR